MDDVAWLIESPGPQYLGIFEYNRTFMWTPDHAKATRFARMLDAGSAMMIAKSYQPELFDGGKWEQTKAVEHKWLNATPSAQSQGAGDWVLVPREPPEDMLRAMHDGPLAAGDYSMGDNQREWLREMYAAALAAAPSAQPQGALQTKLDAVLQEIEIGDKPDMGDVGDLLRDYIRLLVAAPSAPQPEASGTVESDLTTAMDETLRLIEIDLTYGPAEAALARVKRYRRELKDNFGDLIRASARPGLSDDHHKLDTERQVFFYENDFYVLSNFSAFRVLWRGRDFNTSEQAYHWERFATGQEGNRSPAFGSMASAIADEIRYAPSAHVAFKIAQERKSLQRPDWDVVKVEVMRNILRAKTGQHEYVRQKLLATGDRELIEDSWRDDFWGWGPNGDGKNMLGKLWMEVRSEIRDRLTQEPKA